MKKAIFFLVFLSLLPIAKAINISDCAVLDQAGETYYLTSDIIDSNTDMCIQIIAPGITLDCQGHLIDANKSVTLMGLMVDSSPNTVIRNCRMSDWSYNYFYASDNSRIENSTFFMDSFDSSRGYYGVVFDSVSNITIVDSNFINLSWYATSFIFSSNVNISNSYFYNDGIGAYLYETNQVNISNSTFILNYYWATDIIESGGIVIEFSNSYSISRCYFSQNRHGVRLYSSSNCSVTESSFENQNDIGISLFGESYYNLIDSSNFTNNYIGVYVEGAYNEIRNLRIVGSSYYGIMAYGNHNLIYNNLFNNTNNFHLTSIHYWNTTYQAGTNIWNPSLGYIGGNAWFKPDGTGYSETCGDANSDGFCDTPYDLLGDWTNVDYLPIAKTLGQGGCIRNIPEAQIIPSNQTIQRLQTANYTLVVNNTDVNCTPYRFSISELSCPSGLTCEVCNETLCSSEVEVTIGSQASKSLTIRITPSIAGTYVFSYRICGYYCTEANASIVATPIPCVRKPPELGITSPLPEIRIDNYGCGQFYIKNVDEGDCNASTYQLEAICPPYVDCSLTWNTITLDKGAITYDHLCVTPHKAKDDVLKVRARNLAGPFLISELQMNLTVLVCKYLNDGETYVLYKDAINDYSGFRDSTPVCFFGYRDDWILDCNGHSIKFDGTGYGMVLLGYNWTIRNCRIENWAYGLYIQSAGVKVNGTVENCTFFDNYIGAFFDYQPINVTITNSTFEENHIGIRFYADSLENKVIYNKFLNNSYGIEIHKVGATTIFGPTRNEIAYNKFLNNSYGIKLVEGWDNYFHHNRFVSKVGESIVTTRYNRWNSSKIGNYWGRVDGTGYSDTCTDADRNGICDSPYVINSGNIDYLPMSKYVPPPPPPICKYCDPEPLGSLGIVCMIVNLLFCNPILIFILIFFVILFQLYKKKA